MTIFLNNFKFKLNQSEFETPVDDNQIFEANLDGDYYTMTWYDDENELRETIYHTNDAVRAFNLNYWIILKEDI